MIKWFNQRPVRPLWTAVRRLLRRYRRHGVAFSCAALTYYLVFAAFPLLVLLAALPGALGAERESLLQLLGQLVPEQVAAIVDRYREDVLRSGGAKLLWSSAVFSLWLPARATDCLLHALCRAFGTVKPAGLRQKVRTLLVTLCLMILLPLTLLLITVGRRALAFLSSHLGLPLWLGDVWNSFRFVLLALVMALALCALYLLALGRRPVRRVAPGAAAALVAWMAISTFFSYYVEHIASYTQLYGSVAAVVVTLLWLYLSGLAVIMGAELNAVLWRGRNANKEERS